MKRFAGAILVILVVCCAVSLARRLGWAAHRKKQIATVIRMRVVDDVVNRQLADGVTLAIPVWPGEVPVRSLPLSNSAAMANQVVDGWGHDMLISWFSGCQELADGQTVAKSIAPALPRKSDQLVRCLRIRSGGRDGVFESNPSDSFEMICDFDADLILEGDVFLKAAQDIEIGFCPHVPWWAFWRLAA